MPTFLVYKVQEETVCSKWTYEIDAAPEEEALERAQDEEFEPIERGTFGHIDYSSSGWAVRENGSPGGHDAWDEAAKDLAANC